MLVKMKKGILELQLTNSLTYLININSILINSSRIPVLFNTEATDRVFGKTETIRINYSNKHWEKKYKI